MLKPYLQRSVIVPPELGYGADGLQEIPPNGIFELEIELLSVG
jgi:FKBP-type peptidyl-prolyl cis-trans isomerase